LLAAFVMWQRSAVNTSITTQRQVLRERILGDVSYRNSYTPEQRARAEAFDERLNAKARTQIKALRLLRFGLDAILVLAAVFPLLVSWFWFGARVSPLSDTSTGAPKTITHPAALSAIPRAIGIALLVVGGIIAFVLGEAIMVWLRR
jgi:hypothetical protein